MADARIRLKAIDETAGPFAAVQTRMAGLRNEAGALATRFGGLGAAITGALTVGGIAAFVAGVSNSLDRLNDLKDATGASIGNISALEDVAARTGTSFEAVGTSLVKLNQALISAKPGDDISIALKSIGLEAQQLKALDPAEALLEVAKALSQFADDGSKARVVQQLFGRSLREVAPFLKDLAEAGQLNARVTEEQAANAERFANNLAASRKSAEDLGRSVVGAVLPGLLAVQDAFTGASEGGDRFAGIASAVRVAFEAVAVLGANVAFVFKAVGRELGAIGAQTAALARGDFAGFRAISDAVKEDGVRARRELDALEERIMNLGRANAGGGRGFVNPPGIKAPTIGDTTPQVKAQISEFDKYIQRLQEAQAATLDLSAAEQARLDISLGKLGKLTKAQEKQILTQAALLDALKQKDPFAGAQDDAAAERRKSVLDTLALSAESTAGKFDELALKQDEVFGQFQRGEIGPRDYERAMGVLQDRMDGLIPKFVELGDKSDEFAKQAARNIEDALGDATVQALEGKFNQIDRIFGQLVKRLIAQAASAQLAKYLFGEGFGKTGQVGGAVGDFFSWLSSSGNARASGGPVTAGQPYLVGEKGPELVVPQQNANVMPAGSFGGSTFQVIVQGDASENTIRLINNALGQFQARMARAG